MSHESGNVVCKHNHSMTQSLNSGRARPLVCCILRTRIPDVTILWSVNRWYSILRAPDNIAPTQFMLLCALRSAPLHKTLAEVSGVRAQKWKGIYRIPPALFKLVEVQRPAETNHNDTLCGSCASTNYINPCSGMRKHPKTIAQLQVEQAVWIPEVFCFAYPNHNGTKWTNFCKPG